MPDSLPEDFKALVHKSGLYSLRKKYGEGEGLVISVEHFDEERLRTGKMRSVHFGETLQAEFVVETLKEVFPRAKFESLGKALSPEDGRIWAATHPGKVRLFLPMRDHAELAQPVPGGLNMPRIKAANPGLSGVAHGSLRSELGIPKNKFVVSLYFKEEMGNPLRADRVPSAAGVLHAIAQTRQPDLVFISRGGVSGVHFKEKLRRELPGYHFFRLSEFSKIHFIPGEHYAVINDLSGRMPELYNVSDLAVVSGPINFFEPLSSGTKTVIFDNSNVLGTYKKSEFKKMLAIGQATGGAYPVESLTDLRGKLGGILKAPGPSVAPYQAVPAGETRSAAVEYLEHLEEIFRNHLE